MPITQRLFLVFSTALLCMILLLSGYTILTVQKYLEREALVQMKELAGNLRTRSVSNPEKARSLAEESVFLNRYEMLFSGQSAPGFGRPFPTDSIPEIGRRLTENPQALFTFSDSDWIYVTASWLVAGERLTIRKRRSDVGAALRPIRHIIYTGMLISLLFIGIVSMLTARSLARPIKQIAEAAEAIAAGDRSRTLQLTRTDEFGRMAASLNRMADRLLRESDVQRELNERMRIFHSDLAHEIRNPLHAMNASLEMLALDEITPESRTRHEKLVHLQAARLNRLFNDLLTLQKFDESDSPLPLTPVYLAPLVENVAQLHRETLLSKKIPLEIDLTETAVLAHPDRIEQVLENLISNAVKFSETGSIRIFSIDMGDSVEIHVADEAGGIPPGDLDKIFDRFYRVEKSRNSASGGTGLGLAVVRTLLKAQGSDIFVQSREGAGSDFYFRLKKVIG